MSLLFRTVRMTLARHSSTSMPAVSVIGAREVVGAGMNGEPIYVDRVDFPMPAVRFRPENAPDVAQLRVKEKGDWKKLTIDEKKALYRASFCQTFAEMEAPTGEWKSIVGVALVSVSMAFWMYMFFRLFVYNKEIPITFSEEYQQAQLQRMLDLKMNPIEGISSKYDYEKKQWK